MQSFEAAVEWSDYNWVNPHTHILPNLVNVPKKNKLFHSDWKGNPVKTLNTHFKKSHTGSYNSNLLQFSNCLLP